MRQSEFIQTQYRHQIDGMGGATLHEGWPHAHLPSKNYELLQHI